MDQKREKKYEYGKKQAEEKSQANIVKEKPSLALSGNLAKDTNTFNGVVVKYNEPPEARKPIKRWRLYCFKADQEIPFYPIHRQSAYLFGRDRLVADIPVEHPSCSKQHAVLQYRIVEYKRKDGSIGRMIKPYIIDLGSTNGTFLNNKQIEAQRYYELRERDLVKFGFSSREYVLLHEESKNKDDEDELYEEEAEKDNQPQPSASQKQTNDEVTVKKEKVSSSSDSSDDDHDSKQKTNKSNDKRSPSVSSDSSDDRRHKKHKSHKKR